MAKSKSVGTAPAECNVAAVIGALKALLADAQKRHSDHYWEPEIANRWVYLLQQDFPKNWQHLVLKSWRHDGWVLRPDFVAHLQAVIAFLETHRLARQAIANGQDAALPMVIETDFQEVDITPGRKRRLGFFRK